MKIKFNVSVFVIVCVVVIMGFVGYYRLYKPFMAQFEPQTVETIVSKEETIYFDVNSTILTEESTETLKRILDEPTRVGKMFVVANADARGAVRDNLILTNKRAEEVKNYFVGLGIEADSITTIGLGKINAEDESETNRSATVKYKIKESVVKYPEHDVWTHIKIKTGISKIF